MVELKQESYSFTTEELDKIAEKIVKKYSRKKFTEDDLKKIVDNEDIPKKKINRSKTSFQIFMEEYRNKNKGTKQSLLFQNGASTWNKLSEIEKEIYINRANILKTERKKSNENNKLNEDSEFVKMILNCKKNIKIWMYKKLDEYNLILKQGTRGSDLKTENKCFNDTQQMDCYLNKQILLKKKRGFELQVA